MDPLTFESTTHANGTMVLALIGAADISSAAALDRQLTILCAKRPPHVVFDLTRLNFISSLSMGSMVTIGRSCKGWNGRATIAGPQPLVAQAFKHARIDALIPIVETVELALQLPSLTPQR